MPDVAAVRAPSAGVWRVGRNPEPLTIPAPKAHDLRTKRAGNRFDIPGVSVLYAATRLEACFGETLARFRPKAALADLVRDEWDAAGYLKPGSVPAGWRLRRTAVKFRVKQPGASFLDVTSMNTVLALKDELALGLAALGYDDLDLGLVQGPDRRVTRLIAEWAYLQEKDGDTGYADAPYRFAGIRYSSRLNRDWTCWAIFPDCDIAQVHATPVEREMPEFLKVAELFGLRVF